jgi:hypothetical protein
MPWRVSTPLRNDQTDGEVKGHDVSKRKHTRASWYALRMGLHLAARRELVDASESTRMFLKRTARTGAGHLESCS